MKKKRSSKIVERHEMTAKERILLYIASCGARGATDDEGMASTHISQLTYVTHRSQLLGEGLLEELPEERRLTPFHKREIVYRRKVG